MQTADAMNFLETEAPAQFLAILAEFPEWNQRVWSGSWLDTDAMGVDPEWPMWLVDAIEEHGTLWWEEGEPWAHVVTVANSGTGA